ncbi:MAG TPA: RNA methyltransferase [Coleofasciculaceae cyanobacterium]|jgi:TrmH family RNA methyltransferase
MKAPSHQLIKDVAALKQKKFRDERGLILVEGRHPIEEALRAGLKLQQAFTLADQPADSLPNVAWPMSPVVVDEAVMARLSSTSSAPPCLAVFKKPKQPAQVQGDFVLLLDGLQDPGNLGTLIRSAVAFGVDSVVLTGDSVEPTNPKVIRASAGLVFALPILECEHDALPDLFPASDWTIYTTTGVQKALPYRAVDYTGRCVIVLGNEGRGVSKDLFPDYTLQALTIPMDERVESLNVAVSGSVILAEAAARRKAKCSEAQSV